MSAAGRKDWVNRLSKSLRSHESERQAARETLPRYEILEELGRGGMGVVYRAWDPQLGREVALKVLAESAVATPEARARFLREAQVASQLHHPNIVSVYDTGEWMGQAYLALQLVGGVTLDKARLDLRGNLRALRDAARALHYAHGLGVVHRDVKPTNVMIDPQGRAYIMDFGIARRLDVPAKLTLTGVIMGTPCYMSPEQVHGKAADARSDVYSLGATMYDLLAGRPPFQEDDIMATLKAVSDREPPRPRQYDPALPTAVENIILKAIEKEPEHRYASAGDLADDIQRYLEGEPIHARPAPLRFKIRRAAARHRGILITAAVALVALLATLYFLPGIDPQLRRFDREVGKGKLEDAKRMCRELEAAYRLDPHYLDLKTELESRIARKLESDFERLTLLLRGPEITQAQTLFGVMSQVPMDGTHPVLDRGRALLIKAVAAQESVDSFAEACESSLEESAFDRAWRQLKELHDVKAPSPDQRFRTQVQTYERLKGDLERRLTARIGDAFRPAELRLMKEVAPGAYAGVLGRLKEPARLAWNAVDRNQSPEALRDIVARLETVNATTPCSEELRAALDRYGAQIRQEWSALDPEELAKRCRAHGLAAFEAGSEPLLEGLAVFLKSVTQAPAPLVGGVDAARRVLVGTRSLEQAYADDLDAAEAHLAELQQEAIGPEFSPTAEERLARVSLLIRKARIEELGRQVNLASERKRLRAAKGLMVPLLMRAGPSPKDPVVSRALSDVRVLREELETEFDLGLQVLEQAGSGGRGTEFEPRFESLRRAKYDDVPNRDARLAEKVVVLVDTLLARGEETRPGSWLDRGLKLDDGNISLLERRALLHRNAGAWALAETDWRRAAAELEGARNAKELIRKAILCRRLGDFDRGIASLDRAAALPEPGPDRTVEILTLRGQLYYLRGMARDAEIRDLNEAVKDLSKASEMAPQDGRVLYWLGTVLYMGGDALDVGLEASLNRFNQALQSGFRTPHVRYRIANAHVNLRRSSPLRSSPLAEKLATAVLEGEMKLDEDAYVAELHELERRVPRAALDRLKHDCLIVRARARFAIVNPSRENPPGAGALDSSSRDCQAALDIDARSVMAYYYLGQVSYWTGEYAKAKGQFVWVRDNSPFEAQKKLAADWIDACERAIPDQKR